MLGNLPVSSIAKYLDATLPPEWNEYEIETILLELGVEYDQLLVDKIGVIQVFKVMPGLFYHDVWFFMQATDVFNGNVADFESVPSLNSLEVALAIVEASKLLGLPNVESSPPYSFGVRAAIKEILIDDGYSSVLWPFDSVGVTGLSPGAWDSDMAKKEKAIKAYIDGYLSKPGS